MSFAEKKITGIIANPKDTMKIIAQEPLIEEAVLIVGIIAVLGALAGYVQSHKIIFVLEGLENMQSFRQYMEIFSIVGSLISSFLFWLIGTGIIHLISMALRGEGKFNPQMMTISGFSMIPMLFSGILSLALLSMIEPFEITISQTNPEAANVLFNYPYIFTSTIIGIILQIWVAVILIFSVQSAHKLTANKASIAVGITLLIILIPSIWNIWSFVIS